MGEQTMRACIIVDSNGNAIIRGELHEGHSLPEVLLRRFCASDIANLSTSSDADEQLRHVCVDVKFPAWEKPKAPPKRRKKAKPADPQLPLTPNEGVNNV